MLSFQPPQGEDDSIFLQAGGETPFLRTCFKPHLVGAGVPDGPCWTWSEAETAAGTLQSRFARQLP